MIEDEAFVSGTRVLKYLAIENEMNVDLAVTESSLNGDVTYK